MVKCNIFMDWLSEAVGSRQSVIAREKAPAGICPEIRIHNLDHKGIKEDIIIEVRGISQWRPLENIRFEIISLLLLERAGSYILLPD